MNPETTLKAIHTSSDYISELVEKLEDETWDYLSFLEMEKALNDALGHNGDVCWNDMIAEVKILSLASRKGE